MYIFKRGKVHAYLNVYIYTVIHEKKRKIKHMFLF